MPKGRKKPAFKRVSSKVRLDPYAKDEEDEVAKDEQPAAAAASSSSSLSTNLVNSNLSAAAARTTTSSSAWSMASSLPTITDNITMGTFQLVSTSSIAIKNSIEETWAKLLTSVTANDEAERMLACASLARAFALAPVVSMSSISTERLNALIICMLDQSSIGVRTMACDAVSELIEVVADELAAHVDDAQCQARLLEAILSVVTEALKLFFNSNGKSDDDLLAHVLSALNLLRVTLYVFEDMRQAAFTSSSVNEMTLARALVECSLASLNPSISSTSSTSSSSAASSSSSGVAIAAAECAAFVFEDDNNDEHHLLHQQSKLSTDVCQRIGSILASSSSSSSSYSSSSSSSFSTTSTTTNLPLLLRVLLCSLVLNSPQSLSNYNHSSLKEAIDYNAYVGFSALCDEAAKCTRSTTEQLPPPNHLLQMAKTWKAYQRAQLHALRLLSNVISDELAEPTIAQLIDSLLIRCMPPPTTSTSLATLELVMASSKNQGSPLAYWMRHEYIAVDPDAVRDLVASSLSATLACVCSVGQLTSSTVLGVERAKKIANIALRIATAPINVVLYDSNVRCAALELAWTTMSRARDEGAPLFDDVAAVSTDVVVRYCNGLLDLATSSPSSSDFSMRSRALAVLPLLPIVSYDVATALLQAALQNLYAITAATWSASIDDVIDVISAVVDILCDCFVEFNGSYADVAWRSAVQKTPNLLQWLATDVASALERALEQRQQSCSMLNGDNEDDDENMMEEVDDSCLLNLRAFISYRTPK